MVLGDLSSHGKKPITLHPKIEFSELGSERDWVTSSSRGQGDKPEMVVKSPSTTISLGFLWETEWNPPSTRTGLEYVRVMILRYIDLRVVLRLVGLGSPNGTTCILPKSLLWQNRIHCCRSEFSAPLPGPVPKSHQMPDLFSEFQLQTTISSMWMVENFVRNFQECASIAQKLIIEDKVKIIQKTAAANSHLLDVNGEVLCQLLLAVHH